MAPPKMDQVRLELKHNIQSYIWKVVQSILFPLQPL